MRMERHTDWNTGRAGTASFSAFLQADEGMSSPEMALIGLLLASVALLTLLALDSAT